MSYTFGPEALISLLFSDSQIEPLFSQAADVSAMLAFEKALAVAQSKCNLIPALHGQKIADCVDAFEPEMDALKIAFQRDGVVPPSLVAQIRTQLDEALHASFHFGTTSQDLVDTSLMIRLKKAVAIVADRLCVLDRSLATLSNAHSDDLVLVGRTRSQNALPISIPEKIGNWRAQIASAQTAIPQFFPIQLGGPEGAARKFGESYQEVLQDMANMLDLDPANHHWHTDRLPINNIAFWLSQTANVMGKIGQDILMMAQSDVAEVRLAGGGSSSAMPHKQNPVAAEVLVAKARYCQAQMNGLNTAAIHENERSGTAWTLEWMLLPPLVVAAAGAVSNANDLIENLTFVDVKP